MTIRNPKGKAARTVAAKKIDAIVADAQILIDGLKSIAQSYRSNEGNHSYNAGFVDLALDRLVALGQCPVWPRLKRNVLMRAGGRGPVYGSVPLPPPEHIVILCPPGHRHIVEENIRRIGRDPRDKRVHIVSDGDDIQRLRGLDRNTPWFCDFTSRVDDKLLTVCRHRFSGSKVKEFADIINLIDWTQRRL